MLQLFRWNLIRRFVVLWGGEERWRDVAEEQVGKLVELGVRDDAVSVSRVESLSRLY